MSPRAPQPCQDPDEPILPLPRELCCRLCQDILREAMMIPCCAGIVCEECEYSMSW